jgi:hypothetical protein
MLCTVTFHEGEFGREERKEGSVLLKNRRI